MAFELPSESDLRATAERLGIHLDDRELAELRAYVAPFAGAYELIDQLPDATTSAYPRSAARRPPAVENGYGAWHAKGHIEGAPVGPLRGKLAAIKDTFAIAGWPLTAGTHALADHIAEHDATVVTRLLDAGADIVGTTTCEALCMSGGSATAATGPVSNPRVPGHSTGGSSSGSAALVAAGEVDLATGTDQAGSTRVPASFCGIVGIKPTFGLVPYTGIVGLESSLDTVGLLTRTVAESATALSCIVGADGRDPRQGVRQVDERTDYGASLDDGVRGLRIGIVSEAFGQYDSHPEVDASVHAAARTFERLGASVATVSVAWHAFGVPLWAAICLEGSYASFTLGGLVGHNSTNTGLASLARFAAEFRHQADRLPATVKTGLVFAGAIAARDPGRYYAKAHDLRRHLRAAYDAALASFDVLLMPTTRMPASALPAADATFTEVMQRSWEPSSNTCPFNVTGHPSISIPCTPISDGRPVGLQLTARHFDEATLYRAAHAFESA